MRKKHHLVKIVILIILGILIGLGFGFLKVNNIEIWEYFKLAENENIVTMQNITIVDISKEEKRNKQVNTTTSKDQIIPPIGNGSSTNTNGMSTNKYSYFYEQLEDNAKIIYRALEENIENMKTGNYTIKFEKRFAELLATPEGESILKQAYQDAWDAFYSDRVDVFYIDGSKMYLYISTLKTVFKTTYTVSIGPEEGKNYYQEGYQSKEEVEKELVEIEQVKESVKAQLTGDSKNKIKQVNDCLVVSIEYDQTLAKQNTRNIYGALVEREVVCEGYAKAFKYFMDDLGIPCILVSGTATNSSGETEAHLWNYVQLEGNWYAVDVTWNDPIIEGNGKTTTQMMREFLCKGSKTINKDHNPEGNVSENGKMFTYPELNREDYKW